MLTDASDIYLMKAIAVCAVYMLAVFAVHGNPNPEYGKPVKLYRAKPVATVKKPVATVSKCGDDWLCVLAAEREEKKPASVAHGYTEKDRKEMNELFARLP